MMGILDPTITRPEQHFTYTARPHTLKRLRIGLIENTKKNAEAMLCKVAEKLEAAHGMKLQVLVHKPQRAPLLDSQIAELAGRTDFVIAGVGD